MHQNHLCINDVDCSRAALQLVLRILLDVILAQIMLAKNYLSGLSTDVLITSQSTFLPLINPHTSLPFHLCNPLLQIMPHKIPLIHHRNKRRRIRKQIIHLFKRPLRRLRLNSPEPKRIRKITNNKHDVESPADPLERDGSDLSNHGVECKRSHGCDRDTFGPRTGIEDLGGHYPGKGAVGC